MPQRVFGMTRGVSLASIIRDKGALHKLLSALQYLPPKKNLIYPQHRTVQSLNMWHMLTYSDCYPHNKENRSQRRRKKARPLTSVKKRTEGEEKNI